MTANDEKPEQVFYVAHHPEAGYWLCTIAYDPVHCREMLEEQHDSSGDDSDLDEWRIRPVKLVFLDEAK